MVASVGKMRRFLSSRLEAKMGIIILFLLLFNVFAVSFGSSFLREKLPFLANKSEKLILSDLLFIEGAVIFAIGALIASGASVLRIETPSSLYARPSGHVRYLREERKKQFAFGIILIIIGVALMGLSIAIGTFL